MPSPKVATYDLQPEMSAPEVTDKLLAAIASGRFDAIVLNYANTDMVGHSGDLAAAIKAVEAVDTLPRPPLGGAQKPGGTLLVTADHGNVEMMRDPQTGQPAHRAHHQSGAGGAVQPAAPESSASRTGGSPTSPRRCWPCSGSSSLRP